jgi:hypothetical protein
MHCAFSLTWDSTLCHYFTLDHEGEWMYPIIITVITTIWGERMCGCSLLPLLHRRHRSNNNNNKSYSRRHF